MCSGMPAVLGSMSGVLAGAGAYPVVDNHPLPHRDDVRVFICGSQDEIFETGRNCLFIHEKYGPRVRLGTVLTDFDAKVRRESTDRDYFCDKCNICVRACPAQALYGRDFDAENPDEPLMDYRACSEHMKRAYHHIGRGAVCGICMRVCPKGQKSRDETKKL